MASFVLSDLEFILDQIVIAERHAAGENLVDLLPNTEVSFGLRTLDGSYNNLVAGQTAFGSADGLFPRLTTPVFNPAEGMPANFFGPGPAGPLTSYLQTSGFVFDAQPRIISNLIVDQTANNPAAVATAADSGGQVMQGAGIDGVLGTADDTHSFFIPNVAPDAGLSAPFNSWMTFFGQFFDHGLDLVTKGGSGTVFIPLQPDDPLFVPGGNANFMVLTRATNQPGPDGLLGTADDLHEHENTTSPFVDQNQTYSSHPSHQVFLRAYELNAAGDPVATGSLIVNRDLGPDGIYGSADDVVLGGMATWKVVKAQARDILGINLTDADVGDVPLLATDPYGRFIPGPNGFPQVVMKGADGLAGTADDFLMEGNPAAPIDLTNAVRTGHQFLIDIAHAATPFSSSGAPLAADSDGAVGLSEAGAYDNELLDAHYIAGDGRVNENIGLTAVHHVFHAEHNRLVEHVKELVLASADPAFIAQWQLPDGSWNGERLFQAAKFGTEMQYQHLVFEEFARTIQPNVDAFIDFDATIDPAIVAEFAHTVYRFGHSMLTETIDRLDSNFQSSEIGLIEAFLNPLAFANSGATPEAAAGAIIRGVTRQVGNEIDEFVTDALRNNLVGLPLDLAAINLARGRDAGIPSLNAARRTFYEGTGDSQLKPYTSWADFVQHLKHPESLINFIAAYGTHSSITGATTLEAKRAAASAIVLGGAGEPADRLDFLMSTGSWASGIDGVTTTGLDAVDFWIGGLAEEKMPFGGMLGSTFNFVFETQMEALQNGDRFYYLHRTAGLNFLAELENNSFAKLVMLNTDATHLPALIFSTPGFTFEVDPTKQFNASVIAGADGILVDDPLTLVDESADNLPGNADPVGDNVLVPLVIRDNPATVGPDANYLQYTGDQHVVLGGTSGDDIMIASEGDDTLYGDAGNDRLDGGYGNDDIDGGAGDDIISDQGGDDVLKGGAGNDVIHGGNGLNLIIAGPGNDFIVTGEDSSEVIAGSGNDFILGSKLNVQMAGNEGDDWIEIGTQDGAPGDNFDPFGADLIRGNDVFLGDGGFDEMIGEGGDDIMVGSSGPDKYKGMSGYDWVTYKDDRFGVSADMFGDAFNEVRVVPSTAAVMARFAQVEGLSGSAHADILRGDDAGAAQIATAGAQGSVLTQLDLIAGLRALLGSAAAGVDGLTGTADDAFGAGNILLGGDGSDLIEGRGGDDIIDGDAWLNVRISVRDRLDHNLEIRSVNSMKELIPDMMSGAINPAQLEIVREILPGSGGFNFDTAVYSGVLANYEIEGTLGGLPPSDTDGDGFISIRHLDPLDPTVTGVEGTDKIRNIERLQFADQSVVLVPGLNAEAVGALAISDATPAVGQVLTVSAAGVTDADNVATGGAIAGPITFVWQVETAPGSGLFTDLLAADGISLTTGARFTVTPAVEGLALRVHAIYKDQHGVLENAYSGASTAVAPGLAAPPPAAAPLVDHTQASSGGPGLHLIRSDLSFILDQIKLAEAHAAGADLQDLLPNIRVPLGLRTVDGSGNNLLTGQTEFGAADNVFPRLLNPVFNSAEAVPPGFGPPGTTSYAQTGGLVFDSQPRTISNLIVDQSAGNPAAVAAAADNPGATIVTSPGLDGVFGTADDTLTHFIPNVAADAGLSAPFNSWMTFFGQFFDHGLDLVTKGGNGTVFIPLQPDDPLFVPGSPTNFMVLTRATQVAGPGADGVLGTADDTTHEAANTTSPFVDQNQTYSSHPSHQVFLRAYTLNAAGQPMATGSLIVNRDLGPDGIYGTADDVVLGGMATWKVVKAQARDLLGINLTDADVGNVPLLATDAYGNFIRGANGFPQVVMKGADGLGGTTDDVLVEGNPAAPISLANAVRTGHAFLDDIAHNAAPAGKTADSDAAVGLANADASSTATNYDDELLDAHYIAGDGRVNENIGLTAVHHIFHAEHNRLVESTKQTILVAEADTPGFIADWLAPGFSFTPGMSADQIQWNGERLFQAAKFATEMQYQHLVFEEFARTIQPNIDIFVGATQAYDIDLDPSIVAEFAHTVYRFGHSMLTETIDRLDPNFQSSEIGLIAAFLNPLEFAASGATAEAAAGAIIRGVTRQTGNEIDEFVTEALRNNLVGLPLDLAAINLARARDTGVPSLNAARREFYEVTGDSNLKPYTSWTDFAQHVKHAASVINFIAAYGTHATILNATTLADKRAAAMDLVFGGAGAPADREDFLMSTGAWASGANGVTTTGLDAVDFWIGGLAEAKMPFGGMLGSTFNFVFEEQLEKLQNADRFYYLDRTAGLNFQAALENNSFAKMIMANTDVTHLPGLVFSTPGLTLEVDPSKQHTGLNEAGLDGIQGTLDDEVGLDGIAGNSDPLGADLFSALTPLVIRDNPNTAGPDSNFLQYTGDQHVVLGGTAGNDIIISSEGDDTVWGDAGNDRIEGGYGNDMLVGGDGDDIISDMGGDDNLQGGDGNDVLHGGNGLNLIIGGLGQDFIVTGEDSSESFGGPGNDFILGTNGDEQNMGGEGDDWLEGGALDGSPGDNFDPNGLDLIAGNDVFIGSGLPDIMNAEGGDDIMLGRGGPGDKYLGASGFDWASFAGDPQGVNIDLTIRAFNAAPIPASQAAVLARFEQVEGLSGSAHSDILRGDHADAAAISTAGAQGSTLTNLGLIAGLQEFLGAGVTSFNAGNIILGGDGSDIIEGRGGNDLIDGDAWLNVRISVRANTDGSGAELRSVDSLAELLPDMMSGAINPGQLVIVRELMPGSGGFSFDTAVFTGNRAEYSLSTDVNGITTVTHHVLDNLGVVVPGAIGVDGIDRLSHIERLQFADQAVLLGSAVNHAPEGLLSLNDSLPAVGQVLTVSAATVGDADNTLTNGAIAGPIAFFWQVDRGTGVFEDITVLAGGETASVTGSSFTVTPDLEGLQLRVRAIYEDQNGVLETVFSPPTSAVTAVGTVNSAATGTLLLSDPTPVEEVPLSVSGSFADADGLLGATVTLQWQSGSGAAFSDIAGATGPGFTPTQAEVGSQLRVVARFTDDAGNPEQVFSTPTAVVANVNDAPTGSPEIAALPAVEDQLLTAGAGTLADVDGLVGTVLNFQWQAGDGSTFSDIAGATGATFVPGDAEVGAQLRVVTTFTDNQGTLEQVVSAPTAAVLNVNDRPTGADATVTIDEDGAVVFGAASFGFADVDLGDSLSAVRIDSLPTAGALTLAGAAVSAGEVIPLAAIAAGGLVFAPAPDANGVGLAGLSFSVADQAASFASLANTLTIDVTPVNDAAVAQADTLSGSEDAAANFSAALLLGNDSDVEGDPLSIAAVSSGVGGIATLNADGSVSFTPDANFNGVASFSYQASDGQLISAPAVVSINLAAVNDAPVGAADAVAASEDTPIVFAAAALLGNDSDVDGDALSIGSVSSGAGGSVTLNADGSVSFTPDANFNGAASFSYTTSDGTTTSAAAAVSVAVAAVNDTATGLLAINGLAPARGQTLTAGLGTVADIDGMAGASLAYQWQVGSGDSYTDIAGATGASFTPGDAEVGSRLRVVASFTDAGGALEHVVSAASAVVGLDLTGTGGADTLTGTAGSDLLLGGAGNDTLNGLDGNDTLNGGTGNDTMAGGLGDDTYVVNSRLDVVSELPGEGIDTVQTTLGRYTLGAELENLSYRGSGAFTGTGNGAANEIRGGRGADRLDGGAGDDTLIGGRGNDTYIVDSSLDLVVELPGEGTDTVRSSAASYALAANVENLVYTGGGDFSGSGNELNNTITGGAGNDTLDGGAGNDRLVGGRGNDSYVVDSSRDVVVEGGAGGNDTVSTDLVSYRLGANVENLIYTGGGNFAGTGNGLANTLQGGAGNDTLNGGAGADTMIGGAGDDSYVVNSALDVVVEQAGGGNDTVQATGASYTLGDQVENLTRLGAGTFTGTGNGLANTLVGGAGRDTLNGGAGDDVLIGNAGNDTLDGGSGDDAMAGGRGNDSYVVDSLGDTVSELAGQGIDTVNTSLASYTLGDQVERLSYTGGGDFAGTGNGLANLITGGAGNDTLDGGAGNDRLVGGAGDDSYRVDGAADVVVEAAGGGNDTVFASGASYRLGANVENLVFVGSGNFSGAGNGLDNRLQGGAGNDTLRGGGGNDVFVFAAAGFGADRVLDFDANPVGGQDLLDISGLGITAASFDSAVTISDLGADTLLSFAGGESIRLVGVANPASIDVSDFLLAA